MVSTATTTSGISIIISDIRDIPYISNTAPFNFDGYLLKHLPNFFSEKIIGTDDGRLSHFLSISEDILDRVYLELKNLLKEQDIDIASPKYLYQMGQLLGLQELEDLTYSTDFDAIEKQRNFLKEILYIVLSKGTADIFKKYIYGLGISSSINELWTRDFLTYSKTPNIYERELLINPDYTGLVEDDPTLHSGYLAVDNYDIISEIDTALGYATNILYIHKIVSTDYNFTFLLCDNGLYYIDNYNLWHKYPNNPLYPSANIVKDIKYYDDLVFILETGSILKIYSTYDLSKVIYSIPSCNFIDIITKNDRKLLILDETTKITIRDITQFNIIGSISKYSSNIITKVLSKEGDTKWLIFEEGNQQFYILTITNLILSLPLGSPISYSSFMPSSSVIKIQKRADNSFIFFCIEGTKTLATVHMVLSDNTPTYDYWRVSTGLENLIDVSILDDSIALYLSTSGVGIYDYNSQQVNIEVNTIDSDIYTYLNILDTNDKNLERESDILLPTKIFDNSNKIYINKRNISTGKFRLHGLYGFLTRMPKYFKTHYVNLALTDIINTEQQEKILRLIDLFFPVTVNFNSFNYSYSPTDSMSFSDTLTISAISSGGTFYFDGSYTYDGSKIYDGSTNLTII